MTTRKRSTAKSKAQSSQKMKAPSQARKAQGSKSAPKTSEEAKAVKATEATKVTKATEAKEVALDAAEVLETTEVVEEAAVEAAEEAAKVEIAVEEAADPAATAAVSADEAPENQPTDGAEGPEAADADAATPAVAPVDFSALPPVLIVAAEAAPLAKTGGLADVVGALPKYLKKIGVDARIIMPFHRQIKERYACEATHLFDYLAEGAWEDRFVGIDKLELDGTIYYFVDNEYYFGGKIYSGDNFEGQQYAFFTQAVCDVIPNLDFGPGIIHCNDWHTAMVPFKLKARHAREWTPAPATVLSIHNIAFQGTFGDDLAAIAMSPDDRAYAWDLGVWNMMKAGIDTADRVNTVSPTYAEEITTPQFGEGLQDDLRYLRDSGRLVGILNGIDTDVWNPETDPYLPTTFSLKKMAGKKKCKRALLKELGLEVDMDAPLIAMVGRLTPQKGIGLAAHVIGTLVPDGAMFVVLGSGDTDLEWQMRNAEDLYRGRVCSYIGYNNELSHRIYAASDFFLMPSAFEPCGLSQMIAMRYGSLPIVHETGGLKDTVQPFNQFTGEGCGFSFARFDGWDAVEACRRALSAFDDDAIMSQLIKNAMTRDFSFDRCARSYAELYSSMMQ